MAISGFGCRAQTSPAPTLTEQQINARIETIVRSRFSLPPDVVVHIGPRIASELVGYHQVPIVITQGAVSSPPFFFVISDDNKTFARFDKYDLTKAPRDMIPTAGRPARGPENAPVVIVSFDDLQCPYCSQMHHQLFPDAMTRYPGKLRIVYKDFPLTEIHPWAMRAAVDSNCLAAQNNTAYWNFVDYVHAHSDEVNGPGPERKPEVSFATLDRLATDEGTRQKVNLDTLKACIAKQDTTAIQASIDEGRNLRVEATPTLFINGEKLDGARPEEEIWKVIDRALAAEGAPAAK
jgi:protein-disulfide isomerase